MAPVQADVETGTMGGDVVWQNVTTVATNHWSHYVWSVPQLQVSLLIRAVGRVTGKVKHVYLEADSVFTSRPLYHPLTRLPVQPPAWVVR